MLNCLEKAKDSVIIDVSDVNNIKTVEQKKE